MPLRRLRNPECADPPCRRDSRQPPVTVSHNKPGSQPIRAQIQSLESQSRLLDQSFCRSFSPSAGRSTASQRSMVSTRGRVAVYTQCPAEYVPMRFALRPETPGLADRSRITPSCLGPLLRPGDFPGLPAVLRTGANPDPLPEGSSACTLYTPASCAPSLHKTYRAESPDGAVPTVGSL